MMRIVVLTGMSGSGKTNALRALEDIGFYSIDNLPVPLIERLVELFSTTEGDIGRLALVVDARTAPGGATSSPTGDLRVVPLTLEQIRRAGHEVDLVFLDAEEEVLVRRFSETRRRHPLGSGSSVRSGIEGERLVLDPLRSAATIVLDTSGMSVHDLRQHIQQAFRQLETPGSRLRVTIMSFGFKHGLPAEADLVLDVRFIPNPYFDERLRPMTGRDLEVARFVLDREETRGFLARVQDLLTFLLPNYEREGKAYLTIAFGCTGGQHRSVAIAVEVAAWLESTGFSARALHRDAPR